MHTRPAQNLRWTFAITAAALAMFTLDRQVVAIALPSIGREFGVGLQALEWTVSGYTLTFCVLLLPGAALGDRFGRRRLFTAGVAIFTAASAGCALAPSAGALVAARAVQGVGGSLIIPLSLTILAAATPEERRGRVLGSWGAVALGASSLGPVLGGILTGLSWRWVFWLNVPVGLVLLPLARRRLDETHGPHRPLDLVGIAPVAGTLCDRFGPRPLLVASMALETVALVWLALVASPGVSYPDVAPALALAGVAAAGLFAPIQAALLTAVKPEEQGQASGVAMVIRELGGVVGIAILGTVFAAHGGTGSAGEFLAGFRPALLVGAGAAAVGVFVAASLPRARRRHAPTELRPLPATD